MLNKPIKNAIVMMFDSWQFNYTGCYGNTWIKTPNIDRFARESVLFENAYGDNMPTLPVRRSMMTGRFTLHDTGWGPLRPSDTTIADLCWGYGIDTAMAYNSIPLFVGGYFARSYARVSYQRGFDNFFFVNDELYNHYTVDQFLSDPGFLDRLRALPDGAVIEKTNREEYDSYLRDKQYWKTEEDHTVAKNIRAAIKLIKKRDKTHGMHLWIDCWDPHEPWDPPSVWEDKPCPYDPDYKGADLWLPPMSPVKDLYTEEQLHHVRMLFAEKISLCDTYFGLLCDCIREEGMWQNTLLWLTSDHGEPLGNGEHGHGIITKCRPWPYEELVHIPLILKAPGLPAGKRVKAFVQGCDCAPTVLDWLDIPIPESMTGKSLLPLARGEVEKVRDFAIAGYYNFSWSIITEEWSFIHWLDKLENASFGDAMNILYITGDVPEGQNPYDSDSNAIAEYRKQRSLDNEAQWTCTPGSKVEVPEGDELYDRKKDPFQLNNVIAKHPDVAEGLMRKLRMLMSDLRAQ